MTPLDVLASHPQIDSRRVARDLIAELAGRGFAIVRAAEVVTKADAYSETTQALAEARRLRPSP